MVRALSARSGRPPTAVRYGSQPLARGALYLMLQNRIYRGEIVHKGKSYPGEHEAIIDEPLWNNVQAILSGNRIERAHAGATGHAPSLLTGMLFDARGGRMSPTHATKKGTRYRYYVSTVIAGRLDQGQKRGPANPGSCP